MVRLLATIVLATTFLLPVSASASARRAPHVGASATRHRLSSTARAPLRTSAGGDAAVVAIDVAKRYWGAVPCAGQVSIVLDMPLAPGLDPTTDGWVTFNSPLGANDLQAPPSTYTQCTISLAHWQWPTRAAIASDWNMFCLTVIHEMGHLLGHSHSLAPGSVMAPVFTDEANVPPICRATRI